MVQFLCLLFFSNGILVLQDPSTISEAHLEMVTQQNTYYVSTQVSPAIKEEEKYTENNLMDISQVNI